jgi:hypothetical protein
MSNFIGNEISWSINDDTFSPEIAFSATISNYTVSLSSVIYQNGRYLFFERFCNNTGIIFSLGDLVISFEGRRAKKLLLVLGGLSLERKDKKMMRGSLSEVHVLVSDINSQGAIYRFVLNDAFTFIKVDNQATEQSKKAWKKLIDCWYIFVSGTENRKQEPLPSLLNIDDAFYAFSGHQQKQQ